MAQLWNKTTTSRLLVQLPSYIIKTRAIAVSSLEKKIKIETFTPIFGKKWKKNTDIFNGQ